MPFLPAVEEEQAELGNWTQHTMRTSHTSTQHAAASLTLTTLNTLSARWDAVTLPPSAAELAPGWRLEQGRSRRQENVTNSNIL